MTLTRFKFLRLTRPGYRRQRWVRFCQLMLATFLLVWITSVPIRLAIAAYQTPEPQAILVLGGKEAREAFTARFAQQHPGLEIWISSGINPEQSIFLFRAAGIPDAQVHYDRRATDTVTNFTTLVDQFSQHRYQHLYLITSDFHMPRAKAIATVILGSYGIVFTPVEVHSGRPSEDCLRIIRDVLRSVMWLITGYTGADLRDSSLALNLNLVQH